MKTSITVRIARSASCLSVRLSVCLSSLCLSVFSTVSARLSICDHRLSVCPPLSVTSYLSDFCLMRALWLGWQHDGGPNTPSWEVRSMFPSCRAAGRPGGRVRGGSLLSYYCSLSICTQSVLRSVLLPACLSACLSGRGRRLRGCGVRRRRR